MLTAPELRRREQDPCALDRKGDIVFLERRRQDDPPLRIADVAKRGDDADEASRSGHGRPRSSCFSAGVSTYSSRLISSGPSTFFSSSYSAKKSALVNAASPFS